MKFRTGYDIGTDMHHGFTLLLGKRLVGLHWNWPHLTWFNRSWMVDEHGVIKGMPVPRRKPKKWLLRGIVWPVHFEWRRL